MRNIEIVLTVLALVTQIMKISHIEGGDFLSLIMFLTLAFFYMVFMLFAVNGKGIRKFVKEGQHKKYKSFEIVIIILAGIFLSNILVGYLFQILHWMGGDIQYNVGIIGVIFCCILYFVIYRKHNPSATRNLIIRPLFWILFTGIFYYLITGQIISS